MYYISLVANICRCCTNADGRTTPGGWAINTQYQKLKGQSPGVRDHFYLAHMCNLTLSHNMYMHQLWSVCQNFV